MRGLRRPPSATNSALPNVSKAGLGKFGAKRTKCRFCVFPNIWSPALYRKSRKARETIFSSLVAGLVLYWYSSKHLLCSIYFADRWRCNFADRKSARKHVQGGKFEKIRKDLGTHISTKGLELRADKLMVGGGVGWSFDRRQRRAAHFSSAAAASDRMREHSKSTLTGQAFFLGLQGSDTSLVISAVPLAPKS